MLQGGRYESYWTILRFDLVELITVSQIFELTICSLFLLFFFKTILAPTILASRPLSFFNHQDCKMCKLHKQISGHWGRLHVNRDVISWSYITWFSTGSHCNSRETKKGKSNILLWRFQSCFWPRCSGAIVVLEMCPVGFPVFVQYHNWC